MKKVIEKEKLTSSKQLIHLYAEDVHTISLGSEENHRDVFGTLRRTKENLFDNEGRAQYDVIKTDDGGLVPVIFKYIPNNFKIESFFYTEKCFLEAYRDYVRHCIQGHIDAFDKNIPEEYSGLFNYINKRINKLEIRIMEDYRKRKEEEAKNEK